MATNGKKELVICRLPARMFIKFFTKQLKEFHISLSLFVVRAPMSAPTSGTRARPSLQKCVTKIRRLSADGSVVGPATNIDALSGEERKKQ